MARFLFILAAAVAVSPVRGADAEPRYVPIPVEGTLADLFKQRLKSAKADAPFLKLWNDLRSDPKKFKLDPAILKQFDFNNPALRDMLKEFSEKHRDGAGLSAQDLAKLSKVLKDVTIPRAAPQVPVEPPARGGDAPNPVGIADAPAQGAAPGVDRLDRWMRDFMKRAEDTKFGEWLRDSPAFQKGLDDLRNVIDFKSNPSGWGLDALPPRLRLPDNLDFKIGDGLFSGIKNISLPDLPRLDLPHLNLPSVHLGNWSLPAPPVPNIGGLGGAAGAGKALLWILLIGAGLLLVWQISKSIGPRVHIRAKASVLGPWPVDPRRVTTRSQLVQAFDYLALLRLGTEARSWHHRAIARKMLDVNLRPEAVQGLARLYEQARYTTGPEPLPAGDQTAARQNLCLLAEVPAS